MLNNNANHFHKNDVRFIMKCQVLIYLLDLLFVTVPR